MSNRNRRYFVIRLSHDDARKRENLLRELQEGRLRQGWGWFPLVEGDKEIGVSVFGNRYRQAVDHDVDDKEVRRRYRILRPLLDIQKGDLIVIPLAPTRRSFMLAEAAGKYRFEKPDRNKYDDDFTRDFGHVIPVNLVREYDFTSSNEQRILSKKFRAYQSAVNNVWDSKAIDAINALHEGRQSEVNSTAEEIMHAIQKELEEWLHESRKPNEIEDLIKNIFVSAGYKYVRGNHFDKKGGDVDLEFEFPLPILNKSVPIYIQVKLKRGIDNDASRGIKQLSIMKQQLPEDAILVLISTAHKDSFGESGEQEAENNGILLITGADSLRLLALSALDDA